MSLSQIYGQLRSRIQALAQVLHDDHAVSALELCVTVPDGGGTAYCQLVLIRTSNDHRLLIRIAGKTVYRGALAHFYGQAEAA